jgi:hypothetical protein
MSLSTIVDDESNLHLQLEPLILGVEALADLPRIAQILRQFPAQGSNQQVGRTSFDLSDLLVFAAQRIDLMP